MNRFVLLLLLVPGGLLAQTPELDALPRNESGQIEFFDLVRLDSALTTKQISTRARAWVATTFRSATDVVQHYDADAGMLIVKGSITIQASLPYLVYYTMSIEARPGRYRAVMNDFRMPDGTQRAPITSVFVPADRAYSFMRESGLGEKLARKTAAQTILNQQQIAGQMKDTSLAMLADLREKMVQKNDSKKDW